MDKVRTIGEGASTQPDVHRIRESFPDSGLIEGGEIAKAALAELLYLDPESTRFRTVTTAWRKAVMRDSGKLIVMRDGKFVVLDDSGKLDAVKGDLAGASRKIKKARNKGSLVNRTKLSPEERGEYDRVNFRMSKIMEADRLAAKTEIPQLEGATK